MLIDSHCHLDFPDFKDDLNDALRRARDLGVKGFLTINTKLKQAQDLQVLASQYEDVWCTVGVHPHDAEGYWSPTLKEEILALARHSKVVGIGETGLDYHYNHSPKEEQISAFRAHIKASMELDLPLVIHTRNADEDTISVLDDYPNAKGVFHCFSGSYDLCQKALERGYYISLSGIVTFNKADDLRETAKSVPLERLLVETDSPYLAPIPHRGKRNEPAFVVHTAEKIAETLGIPYVDLCKATTQNFFTLFNKTKGAA